MLSVFEAVMNDKTSFIEFFNDAEKLVREIVDCNIEDRHVFMRALHTLKGNCALFGVHSVADVCHQIEETCNQNVRKADYEERDNLMKTWDIFSESVRALTGEEDHVLEIYYPELESLLSSVRNKAPHALLLKKLQNLKLESTEVRFSRISQQAKRLAKKLNKGAIHVKIESNQVRLPAEHWGDFWSSFVHLIRNALDHGVESKEERRLAGKSPEGTLTFASTIEHDHFLIRVKDDGRGINWGVVQEKAEALGLPSASHKHLVQALLSDGLSTREKVDVLSGRGVGMSAVKAACDALGGTIDILSAPQGGTTIQFKIPCKGNDRIDVESYEAGVRPSISPKDILSETPQEQAS